MMSIRRWLNYLRFPVAFLIAVAVMTATVPGDLTRAIAQSKPATPTYACAAPNDCHGIVGWTGSTSGARTVMDLSPIGFYNYYYTDYLQSKMFVTGSGGHIEVGYSTVPGWIGDHAEHFWADRRPSDPTYYYHDIGEVQDVDWNTSADWKVERISATSYRIKLDTFMYSYNPHYSNDPKGHFSASHIVIGTQLRGTKDAYMIPETHFRQNQWQLSNGQFQYQTANGGALGPNPGPISQRWVTLPSQSGTGGDFETDCCDSDND